MVDEARDAGFDPHEWRGVFLLKGHRLSISSFSISMNDKGEMISDGPQLATGVEMMPYWLEIAIEHAIRAEKLERKTDAAWTGELIPQKQVKAIEAELKASLQAMTAAAFAIDAFYATVEEAAPTAPLTRAAWRKNNTKRSRRVYETLRRNFPLTAESQRMLQGFLDQLFSFRDRAVHPSARTSDAIKHPRLPISIDKIFCIFRARNAFVSVGQVVELINTLVRHPKIKNAAVNERMSPLKELVVPLVKRWRRSRAAMRHRSTIES